MIYRGPHKGIHTDWGVVESFCKESKTTSKKFRTEEAARFSLSTYEESSSSNNQPLLRPKLSKAKENHRDHRFVISKEILDEVAAQPLTNRDFKQLWDKARMACSEDFISERFYTTDKKSKSLYNFIEGADPQLVHQAFQASLVHNIYPSSNLQELKLFPAPMVEAIKNFRKKVLKAKDEPLYINFSKIFFCLNKIYYNLSRDQGYMCQSYQSEIEYFVKWFVPKEYSGDKLGFVR